MTSRGSPRVLKEPSRQVKSPTKPTTRSNPCKSPVSSSKKTAQTTTTPPARGGYSSMAEDMQFDTTQPQMALPEMHPSRPTQPPPRTPLTSGCEHCHGPLEEYDPVVTITLPGETAAATLHARCKGDWIQQHAKRCVHCGDPMPSEVQTVALPGGEPQQMHPHCTDTWIAANARKCDHCKMPLTEGAVQLSGAFGTACVHEKCCDAFEEEVKQRPKKTELRRSTSPCRSPKAGAVPCTDGKARCKECNKGGGAMLSVTGPWGTVEVHAKCREAFEKKRTRADPGMGTAGNGRCDFCLKRFAVTDSPQYVKPPGSPKLVTVHTGCRDRWALNVGLQCDNCGLAMPESATQLTGLFGKAEVHPECVESYEAKIRANGNRKPPRPSLSPRSGSGGTSPRW